MPDRLILHVGPHKTGSTALQRMLKDSREELAREGIVYPAAGLRTAGHHLVVLHCQGCPVPFDPSEFRAEISRSPVSVISSENFATAPEATLGIVRELFPDRPVEVFYYLRRLCDLWPSHWQELIKHGLTLSFAEYLMRLTLGRDQPPWIDADQLTQLTRLARVFGRESLRIVGYDRVEDAGIDVGVDFQTAILGRVKADVMARTTRANPSLLLWQVELIRALNAIHHQRFGSSPNDALRERVLDHLDKESPTWLAEFRELVAGAPRFDLNSENPCVDLLQRQVLDAFGDRIHGDRDATIAAYLRPRRVRASLFEWSLTARDSLRRSLLSYHLDLIGAGLPV